MQRQWSVHHAIVVLDVERFGDPARTNLNQLAVRDAFYKAITMAFRESGVVWDNCVREDRGDGALILVPQDVPKICLVTSLPERLAAAVTQHNSVSPTAERIRLRMALHAGEVYRDAHGVAGAAINHAFRLVEAPLLRTALGTSPGVLAIIVSDWLFSEVVRHDPAAGPNLYRQVRVIVKETSAMGWIRVPDPAITPALSNQSAYLQPEHRAAPTLLVRRSQATSGLISGGNVTYLPELNLTSSDGVVSPRRRPIPAQLPHDVLGFVGRGRELTALASVAAGQGGTALVIPAIDGVAGIGKTALAIHFAHRVAVAFPDGQLFVNLRGFDPDQPPLSPGDVLNGFLRALGADPSQIPADLDELAAMYRTMLSDRRILIVLDNAASAEQIRPLLPGMAGCLAIVTSRSRLSGLVARDGAQRLTLDVLPPGDAVALIAQIAGDERVAADPAATRRLAQLCGWSPLALRITADRAATHLHLGMADLVDELTLEQDRLDILSAEEKTTQVRAVFSWSYRALPPGSARAFRLLGLHLGPDISAPAAAALIDVSITEARQLIKTLTGGHLLEEIERDRYQFHDLVRIYAAECAQDDESADNRTLAARRLLTWYLHTANAFFCTFNPDNRHVPLERPEPACRPLTFATYRQALDWARGELANLIPTVRRAAIAADEIAWKLPVTLLPVFSIQRRTLDLLPALDSALIATRKLEDRTAEAWIMICLAEANIDIGRPARAAEFCQRALAISTKIGDLYGQWAAPYVEGSSYVELKRFSEARDCLQHALRAARLASNIRAEGMSLDRLGVVHQHLGSVDTAIDLHQKALDILNQTQSRWRRGDAIKHLADAYRAQGRIGHAIEHYRRARTVFHEIGDYWGEANLLTELGHAQRTIGLADEARQSWQLAFSIFEEFGDTRAEEVRTQLRTLGNRPVL